MQLEKFNKSLLKEVQAENYAGYDPFDGLNSKFINWSEKLKNSIFGLAWIQFFKRSPINFRAFALVPKKRNPKGIGLFILGLLNDFRRTGEETYLNEAIKLGQWLLAQQCDKVKWTYSCWGYHFDWKAKAFYVPKGKPNVITTIYVAQALYALYEQTGDDCYKLAAFDSANFIYTTLLSKSSDGKPFIAYIPGEKAFVHNASLWGAAWLAFVGSKTDNELFKITALEVARRSVREQASDGSWVYGAMSHHQFIDGFHTGYNLEALHIIRRSLGTSEFDQSIVIGLEYYEKNFFTPDGIAKYYNNNIYPMDMHSVSQAIITLITIEPSPERVTLAKKVLKKSFDVLLIKEQSQFAYQRTAKSLNKINYVRWTQAWVYYSFSLYLLAQDENERNQVS